MFRLKHELSDKEKISIVVASIVLMGTLYYFAVYRPCMTMMGKYDTTQLSDEMIIEQTKLVSSKNMQAGIDANQKAGVGQVFPYNHLHHEVNALNQILSSVDNFDVDFDSPIKNGSTVNRNVNISFMTADYESAKVILTKLYKCEYRCLLKDVNIQTDEDGCSVSVQVTFVETMENATTSEGLVESSDTTVGSV